MSLSLVLIIAGLGICFGAFGFAAINIIFRVRGTTSKVFLKHISAIIVMAFGGLLFIVGLILAGVNILSRVI